MDGSITPTKKTVVKPITKGNTASHLYPLYAAQIVSPISIININVSFHFYHLLPPPLFKLKIYNLKTIYCLLGQFFIDILFTLLKV